ncbi:Pycsar system effector family protein [Demequina sp. SO4-18]|uniref:Pycsar system effector family protein n=1 Tax=Demequina sp. SO4-18 TaxID=3401026 RepID=UPI003B5A6D19
MFRGRRRVERPVSLGVSWEVLRWTAEWIRFADAKAGATLAAAGASAAVLATFATRGGTDAHSPWSVAFACGSAAALLGVSILALLVLAPRLGRQGGGSLVYFGHIAKEYGESGDNYALALAEVESNPASWRQHLAQQITVNARIAERKYRATSWSIRFLVVGIWLGGATAIAAQMGV